MSGARTRNVGAFVRARRGGWERLEALAARAESQRLPLSEVRELDRLYRRAAGDLAFARAAFPGSDAEVHLTQVTARAYGALYRPRGGAIARAWRVLSVDAPAAVRGHAGSLALAAALLVGAATAGGLAVVLHPRAAELLVPEQVRDAVAAKRMWTEHLLQVAPGVSGSAIAHNNVTVASLAFALGLTGGIGTAVLLVTNGLLLGAVLAHAAQGGMAGPLLGFVAAHGPAELSALVLAGQAGFILAAAVIDPGEWPRSAAIAQAGRAAAPVMGVGVPVLALVALLESTLSPSQGIPPWGKGLLGVALACALWSFLLLTQSRAGGRSEPVGTRVADRVP